MVLSVCCDKNSNKAADLENSLSAITSDYTLTSDVIEVTEKDRAEASDLNTTAGKLALILDVVSKEDKLTKKDVKDFVDKSVKQIAETIDDSKKTLKLPHLTAKRFQKPLHHRLLQALPLTARQLTAAMQASQMTRPALRIQAIQTRLTNRQIQL